MAQSTTNLGKIHVFPSETLYNQFKNLVADNDLALLKDDGAYIIAANLAQNGYVKFSNGLILQWGVAKGSSNSPKTNFPISFKSNVFRVVNTLNKNTSISDAFNMHEGIPKNISLSGFTIWVDNATGAVFDYIALGV